MATPTTTTTMSNERVDEDGNNDDDEDGGEGKRRASYRDDPELDLVPLEEEEARLNPPPTGRRSLAKQHKLAALRRENLEDVSDEEDFVDHDHHHDHDHDRR
jgi:hypothetical protein